MYEKAQIQGKVNVKVSVVLVTYQQEHLVRESLESLINQDYPDLQIVVSDDASTDKTWEVVQEITLQAPPHVRVVLNRNDINLGIIGNYNRAVSLCDGELIFSAAGDDVSEVNRVRACVELWQATGQVADLIATDLFDMTYKGEILAIKEIDDLQSWSLARWIQKRPYHAGASHMVTRRLLSVQPLNAKAKLEDQCLLFRALLMGGALRLEQPLVRHRRGGVSNATTVKTYDTQRANLMASARQGVHEVDQYLSDAFLLGSCGGVIVYLQGLRRNFEFTLACLEATSLSERVGVVLKHADVSLRTRQRFFLFASLRPIYEWFFKVRMYFK